MLPTTLRQPWFKRRKYISLMLVPTIFVLACASGLSLPLSSTPPTPTDSAFVIDLAVTVVYRTTATPTPLPGSPLVTNTLAALTDTTTLANLPTTDTPAPTATPTLTPTNTPLPPSPPTLEVTATLTTSTTLTETAALSPTTPITTPTPMPGTFGTIGLFAPDSGAAVPLNSGLDFKWQWNGSPACNLPQGYGFEVRIWPAITGYGPLGAMDAVASQPQVGCDPENGIYNYNLADLNSAPGVQQTWVGKFLWDVAFVRLNPYTVTVDSGERLFEILLVYNGPLDPFGVPVKCSDFRTPAEAQAFFYAAGGPGKDPHNLDPDLDGNACGFQP